MCAVTRISRVYWVKHTTRIDLGFEWFDCYGDGLYTFRHEGYFIRVGRSAVVHREDEYAQGR